MTPYPYLGYKIVTIQKQFVGIACLMKDIFETISLYFYTLWY